MAKQERTSAGLEVKIGGAAGTVVGVITSFGESYDVSEEETTGSEDTVGTAGSYIVRQRFLATAVGHTANVGGVALASGTGAAGQSALKAAVEVGDTVSLYYKDQHNAAKTLSGFFTNYEESAELPNAFRFTASFRANSET